MSLNQLITNQASMNDIRAFLDELSPENRLKEVLSLNKKAQVALYELAIDSATIDLSFFVAPTTAPLAEVIHSGINSLPLPMTFRKFQKRFCRQDENSSSLAGYNHGATTGWVGPGYFVAKSTKGNQEWEQRGGVVIDYYEIPSPPLVETWPKLKRNNQGLQILVYDKMRDFMRGVSKHVSIGVAYKKGKNMGNYFILCRED